MNMNQKGILTNKNERGKKRIEKGRREGRKAGVTFGWKKERTEGRQESTTKRRERPTKTRLESGAPSQHPVLYQR